MGREPVAEIDRLRHYSFLGLGLVDQLAALDRGLEPLAGPPSQSKTNR